MTFTPRKYKDIFDEMRGMSQVVTDFEVGSVARTMYESFSYELALLYEKMQMVYLSAYVDTAQGNQLDQVVAVLGIERSQPDFAEGIVSFQRDGAGQEIVIPTGTLVATEESSTGEKFVFQTTKEAILGAVRTRVDVPVRAVERGEEFETSAETVVVMPRPVPGIKSVINNDPIRLVGKRRETDEELRARAKTALISSGKATILSIENALLSLSGVRDARVRENFHFARADARIELMGTGAERIIPRGTTLLAKPGDHPFRTMEMVIFLDTDPSGTQKDVRIESLLEGKIGEIPNNNNINLEWDDNGLQNTTPITLLTPARLENFGVIEVYVDAPRLESGTAEEKRAEQDRLVAAIDKVRAAGIFSILKPASKVRLSAVFRIDINPSLNLSGEERRAFEVQLEDEITGFIGELRMGSPLLYGKLIKHILSTDNVENLTDFQGEIIRKVDEEDQVFPIAFNDAEKLIKVEEFERISARHIAVATEDKPLKLHMSYQASGMDANVADLVQQGLTLAFAGYNTGEDLEVGNIEAVVAAYAALSPGTFEIRPESWYPGPEDDPRAILYDLNGTSMVKVTYVERPVLGTVFGFEEKLLITGAIKLILPLNITAGDANQVKAKVQAAIEARLAALGPEEDILFEELIAASNGVSQVLATEILAEDFAVEAGGLELPNLIDDDKIDVTPFKRAYLQNLLISQGVERMNLEVLGISVTMGNPNAPVPDQQAVQQAVMIAWTNALNGFKAGDDVAYTDLKSALENRVPGVPYTVSTLNLIAVSEGDGRVQNRSLVDTRSFHTRSMEVARTVPIAPLAFTLIV